MRGGCGSWFPQQQLDWQSPNLNSSPMHLGQQNVFCPIMNPGSNMISPNGTLPVNGYRLPHSQVVETNEHHGWFNPLPRFQQAFKPVFTSVLKEQQPADLYFNFDDVIKPKANSGCAQKKFLVFDQSGDQTTLIFSSGIENPLTSLSPKPPGAYNLAKDGPGFKGETNGDFAPASVNGLDEIIGTDLQSEMQEDTEELNALLYSDDDSDYTEEDDDDEVTSTGHSPSTMTAHEKLDWFEGGNEEVASSAGPELGPTKKRKLFDRDYDDLPTIRPTASFMEFNPHPHPVSEDDAESSCANSQNPRSGEMGLPSENKRMRSEKIRETVNALRCIIPGGKSKDAMVVIDEAINYLKSLKHKAKALGHDNGL